MTIACLLPEARMIGVNALETTNTKCSLVVVELLCLIVVICSNRAIECLRNNAAIVECFAMCEIESVNLSVNEMW